MNLRPMQAAPTRRTRSGGTTSCFTLPSAVGVAVFLLLFMGNFGHNLFRFTWLWYGGFLIIARHCAELRVANWEPVAGAD